MTTQRLSDMSVPVVVIGGGPSGATAATLIAQQGHRVVLLEREHFPRFHIGESLIPETYWVFERLNMLPKLRASHNVKKHSVQFVGPSGRLSEPFYFTEHKPHECSQTWQVLRSEFDQMMLDNAREHGVEVHEGARVLEVLFEGDRAVGVKVRDDSGAEHTIHSQVVVDASGQSSMITSRLGLRDWDEKLKKAAVWTYWEGAYRDSGIDEGATIVIATEGKKGWFWYIPQHNNIVSVGIVADETHLFENRPDKNLEAVYFEQVDRCPGVKPRIENAKRVAPFRVAKEYTYKSRQVAGDGWVAVGDAYGFLDPLYSSGVLLALKSGQLAADAISEGLAKGDTSRAQIGNWEEMYARGVQRMRKFVLAYYEGFSFGRFIRKHPHLKGYVTDLLIGDVFDDKVDAVFGPMEEMQAEMNATAD